MGWAETIYNDVWFSRYVCKNLVQLDGVRINILQLVRKIGLIVIGHIFCWEIEVKKQLVQLWCIQALGVGSGLFELCRTLLVMPEFCLWFLEICIFGNYSHDLFICHHFGWVMRCMVVLWFLDSSQIPTWLLIGNCFCNWGFHPQKMFP